MGDIDQIDLAECILFLRKVKRNIVVDPKRIEDSYENILDTFLNVYKSGTAYAIKQIGYPQQNLISGLFRDLLGEWVLLEEEVFLFVEMKKANKRASDEHHLRIERVLYDERAEQNQLDVQEDLSISEENSMEEEIEIENDQTNLEYEQLFAKCLSVNEIVHQMNLEQDQKYQEDIKGSQQNTADISDLIYENDMRIFGTPPEFKRCYDNRQEIFETPMEEEIENDEDNEIDEGMKKINLHVFGQNNNSIVVENEEQRIEELQEVQLCEQQEQQSEQKQQDQQGDDNNSEQKQQLDLGQQHQNGQSSFQNEEFQETSNNNYPCAQDSRDQQVDSSQNVTSEVPTLEQIQINPETEINNQQQDLTTNINNLVADDLFSNDDPSQSKSQQGILENPSKSQTDNEDSNKDSQLQVFNEVQQKDDQESLNKQSNQLEQLPTQQQDQKLVEQKQDKPKIDLSLHHDPCFSNPPSPIKNPTTPAEEQQQHEIFQENPCNPDDLFPDEQIFYHPNNNQTQEPANPSPPSLSQPLRSFADQYESQDIDYQLSQQLFQEDNDNQETQLQDEEIFSYEDQSIPNNPQCSSGSDKKNNNNNVNCTQSHISSYQDYQQNNESFGQYGIGYDNKEYDQLMVQHIEETVVNISAEENEYKALEPFNTTERVRKNRQLHEYSMDSRRKFLNLFKKPSYQRTPKPFTPRPNRCNKRLFRPTEIYKAKGVGSLQESRLLDEKKGRLLVQRRGFQKSSNQEYQFDSDRDNGVESGDENKRKLKYLIKLQFIEQIEQKVVDLLMLSSSGVVCLLRNIHQLPEIRSLNEVNSTDGMGNCQQMKIFDWQNRCEILKIESIVQDLVFSQKLSRLVCKCSNVTLKIYSLEISNHTSNSQDETDKPMEIQERTTRFQLLHIIDVSFMYMCLIEAHSAVGLFSKDSPLKYIHLDNFCDVEKFEIVQTDPTFKHSQLTSQKNLFPFFVYNAENNWLLVSSSETAFVFYEVIQKNQKQQMQIEQEGEQQSLPMDLQLKFIYQLECNTIGHVKSLTFMTGTTPMYDQENSIGITPPRLLTGGSTQILGMWDLESRNLKAVTQLPMLPLQVMQNEQIIVRDQFNIITIEPNDLIATREYAISKKKGVSTTASDISKSLNIVAVATNDKQIVLVQLENNEEENYEQQF